MVAGIKAGQSATGFAAALAPSLDATLPGTATADNAILFAVGGDKDLGTITLPGFTQSVYLHTANTSLLLAWKVAVGTETLISATYTSGNGAGSNTYVAEIEDPDSAQPWEEKCTAGTSVDGGGNVTSKVSGTTGTIAALNSTALAIAGFSVDSVNTSPAPSYTNAYTGVRSMGSGGTEGGLWVAILSILAAGGTTSTTIDRDPTLLGTVTADQMNGGVFVLGRQVAPAGSPAAAPPARPGRRVRASLVR